MNIVDRYQAYAAAFEAIPAQKGWGPVTSETV